MSRAIRALAVSASALFIISTFIISTISSPRAQSASGQSAAGQTSPAGNSQPGSDSRSEGIDLIITPNRVPTAIQRTGSAVTVIPAEDIRKANPASLASLLRDVPGLDVTENGGPGQPANIRLRGANSGQTLVLVDGVRVNDPSLASSEFDFASLAPGLIDRIEVLRGPQSALYGSDAIGGVVNIITRRGKGPFQAFAQVEGGSYGTLSANTGAYGSKGPWSYAFALSALRSDGFSSYGYRVGRVTRALPKLERDSLNRYGGYARLGFDAGNGYRLEAGTMGTFTRAGYDAGFGAFPDTPSRVDATFHSSFAKAELDTLDARLRHSLQIFGNRTRRQYDSITYGATRAPADTFFDKYDYIGQRVGAEYQATYRLETLGSVILGGKLEREMIESYSESLSPFPVARTRDVGKGQSTRSLFALWQVPVGQRLDLSFGARIDDVSHVATFRTWRVTAAYRIDETGTKLRASLGTGGKAPSLYQLHAPFFGTPTLRPERSLGGDIGIDQRLFDGRLKLSVTGFGNRMKDMIDFDFGTFTFQNIARAETSGIETAAEAVLMPERLTLKGTYTFLRAVDRNTGLRLARRADHMGKIGLAITPTPKWSIEPSLVLVSKRFSSTNQTQRLAPYARLDMLTTYRLREGVDVYLRGENLGNARYQDVTNYATTGRAVYAGMRGTW